MTIIHIEEENNQIGKVKGDFQQLYINVTNSNMETIFNVTNSCLK